MRRAFVLGLAALGLALAAGCPGARYALKTPYGRLQGAELHYRAGVLEVKKACFESQDLRFQAPLVRYQKAAGVLTAREPAGEVQGYRFSARTLTARDGGVILEDARFTRGSLTVVAREARAAGSTVELFDLTARTPRYRFSARRGRFSDGRFWAEDVWGTPCRSGDALALAGRRAVFDSRTARLLVEESAVHYYGICLARPARLLIDTRKPPHLNVPLRFSLDTGLTLGVEGLSLPEEGVPLGEGKTRLTVLAERLGTGRAGLTAGLSWKDAGFRLGVDAAGGFAMRLWAPGLVTERRSGGDAYLALAPTFGLGPLTLAPTAVLVDTGAGAYLGYGLGARARFAARAGEASFSLAPWFLGLAYPDAPAFAGLGLSLSVDYRGLFLSYTRSHRLGAPRSFWEAARVAEAESAGLRYGAFSLVWRRDFADGWARLSARVDGPLWLLVQKGFGGQAGRLEAVLGYRAPDPGPGGFALSPSLGYDLGSGQVSRAGLAVAYADGCLVYRLVGDWVGLPWPGEAPGFRLAMGLNLL